MSYLWQEFNIKTFAAETIVYRDGVFCPELSTLPSPQITAPSQLPIHIIYVGEIAGENRLDIHVTHPGQRVFLSAKIKNKKPAFLNIFIKNTGKNSEIRGGVFAQNSDHLNLVVDARHGAADTTVIIRTKLIAEEKSVSKLTGTAHIEKNCPDCTSDISFTAMAADSAKIEFRPAQRICAAPKSADHSASIYRATDAQIQFLRMAGLGTAEVSAAIREA
ncbi:MAG: SufD family Fe-S cluster assembly protein, partial [Alphaproteobacteria bacterium]|nr:SufD family Fe-S cluster assembly protein [Alphaproteobacteria bacterium]